MTTGNRSFKATYQAWSNWRGASLEFGMIRDVTWMGPNSVPPSAKTHNTFRRNIWRQECFPARWGGWMSSPQYDVPWGVQNGIWNLFDSTPGPTAIEMWSKMAEEIRRHKLNAAVSFAEANKTLKHLTDTAGRIVLAAGQFRRGNVVGGLKALGFRRIAKTRMYRSKRSGLVYEGKQVKEGFDPGSLWLEYKYAWIPLYSDVYETFRHVHAQLNKRREKTYVVYGQKVAVPARGDGLNANKIFFLQNEGYKRSKLTLVGDDGWIPVDAAGLENPELIAWELVPFSFVWDWFQPIGTWLEARGLVRQLSGWKYHYSDRHWYKWVLNCPKTYAAIGQGPLNSPTETRWQWEHLHYERGALTTIDRGTWTTITLPDFNPPGESNMTLARAATSLALIVPTMRNLLGSAEKPRNRTLR